MPTLKQSDKIFLSKKREGQLWVFWSMECEMHYKWQYEEKVFSLFDLKARYKLNSDLPIPYFNISHNKSLRTPPIEKTLFTNAFISSQFDQSNRTNLLGALMSYLHIDSFGKILNNCSVPDDKGSSTKESVISKYKFTIAFENAIAIDYVTEKFFQPLIVGSVPIYLGAPNIEDFSPGCHSYIDVNSFSNIKDLAEYLEFLDNNDGEYMKFLKWKEQPFKKSFLDNMQKTHFITRLCKLLEQFLQTADKSPNLTLNKT